MAEQIPSALDGERVDRVLTMLTGMSRSQAASLVAEGGVELDGRVVTTRSAKVREGQIFSFVFEPAQSEQAVGDTSVAVDIIHSDDQVVVVNKSVGQVVHLGSGNLSGTMVNGLIATFPEIATVGEPDRPGVVHRLDKGTSGVMMFARTENALASLSDQLRTRTVSRTYLTLVHGAPDEDVGAIEAALGRSIRDPTRMVVRPDGKEARTTYEVVARNEEGTASLLRCRLDTGRTHQIRVHMLAIGHPVIGDDKYSGGRDRFHAARPLLHSRSIEFDSPTSGARERYVAPPPQDMVEVANELGLADSFASLEP